MQQFIFFPALDYILCFIESKSYISNVLWIHFRQILYWLMQIYSFCTFFTYVDGINIYIFGQLIFQTLQ